MWTPKDVPRAADGWTADSRLPVGCDICLRMGRSSHLRSEAGGQDEPGRGRGAAEVGKRALGRLRSLAELLLARAIPPGQIADLGNFRLGP
jgi:hypothetical protein